MKEAKLLEIIAEQSRLIDELNENIKTLIEELTEEDYQ